MTWGLQIAKVFRHVPLGSAGPCQWLGVDWATQADDEGATVFDYRITCHNPDGQSAEVRFSDSVAAFQYVLGTRAQGLTVDRITEGGMDFTDQFLAMVEAARSERADARP